LEVLKFIATVETENQSPILKPLTAQEFVARFSGGIPDFPEVENQKTF